MSHLVLKPLQIQTLRKKVGDMTYYVLPSKKVGGHVPRVPHQIAPMPAITNVIHKLPMVLHTILINN